MAEQATAPSRSPQSPVSGLARFFPEATPLRIPINLARCCGEPALPGAFTESTVIEFGTPREVIFACATPLEFSDVIRIRNSDGSLDVQATVVAVQYHPGKTVVAARFLSEVANWIVKP